MPKLLLDMDGVLVDCIRGIMDYHNLPRDMYDRPESLGDFDIQVLSGIPKEEFWAPLGYTFWLNLPWMHDGQQILQLCEKVIGSQNICLLTSPIITPGCLQGKVDWICREMPKYRRSYLLGPRKEFCARADNILLDDSDKNVSMFLAHGGQAILVPRPWNSQHKYKDDTLEVIRKCLTARV